MLDVYPAREQPVGSLEGVSGRMVAAAAADSAGGRPVWWLPDAAIAAEALGPRLTQGDVLITIGAVGVSGAPGGDKDEVCAQAAIDKVADQLK